jgi:ATP-dependent Clp protease adaptor protein ClpS
MINSISGFEKNYVFLSNKIPPMAKEKSHSSEELDELMTDDHLLVLFNDDHNTFDHVINSLIEVCEHDPHQAEQCALLAHFKGKCGIKSGTFDELKVLHEEMGRRDLTVEIQ